MLRILMLVLAVGVAWGLYMILRAKRNARKNPHERLQKIIEEETAKLHAATEALRASENFVRQLQREVDVRSGDVAQLTGNIKRLVGEGKEDQAKIYINTLTHKERELEIAKEKLQKGIEQHEKSVEIVNSYRTMLKNLKQEASELQLRVNLAQVEQQAAALGANLEAHVDLSGYESAKEEIEQLINSRRAEAEIDNRLRAKPEDEFLKACTAEEVEERLNQYKTELKKE